MQFKKLEIPGVVLVSLDIIEDERGFFARSFCRHEFAEYGLCTEFVQCNLSYNRKRGTLRGMHYQVAPYAEVKIVSCIKGAIYDVVLDIRETSPTCGKWISVELTEDNKEMLYIPKGIAHGFQTLADDTLVYYQMGEFFHPEAARGIRFDDPKFGIMWPLKKKIMSDKDKQYELYR